MKLLVIGLDGVDRALVERFDMPVLQGILEQNTQVPIKEDLWARGWVKVLSGLPGTETGAFYEQPKLNGSGEFTQSFGTSKYAGLKKPPLWQAMGDRGVTSGWLNLPTTMPAASVDGFMVSGAGGGVSPSDRLPRKACFPAEMTDELTQDRMCWENRFRVSGYRSADTYIPACTDAIWQRARIFSRLVKKYHVDGLGFLAQKEPVLLTNVFMHDVLNHRIDGTEFATRQLLKNFFNCLDDTIDFLCKTLQPDNVAIVSDHGAGPYRKSLNLNALLHRNDLVKFPSQPGQNRVKKQIRFVSRMALRKLLGSDAIPYDSWHPYRQAIDHTRTQAFAHFYVPGVYINDERFSGTVTNAADKQRLVRQIIDLINHDPLLSSENIVATPFRELHSECPFADLLPEIWVDLPDDVFPEHMGKLLAKNPLDRHWFDLRDLPRDIGSGKKTPAALCSFPKELVERVPLAELPHDLTAAYHCIQAAFLP
ncbi:MAG: hypothetical protein CL681_10320 [Blastopirellula sp.]|nr:hypothetical protein [Blastopirellula sp.]